jgi:hypothetical protein
MRVGILIGVVLLAFAATAAPAAAGGWAADCGTEGKAPCAFSAAKFEFKQIGLCPSGQFWDLIEGGTCWSCPQGFGRTVFAVNTDKACEKVASTDFRRANENNKGTGWFGTDCPGGQFWDIVDGKCHSCPDGYAMQVLEHVHGDRKCAKGIPGTFAAATKSGPPCGDKNLWDPRNGGECWSCPSIFKRTVAPVTSNLACEYIGIGGGTGLIGCNPGLVPIRGTCLKRDVCGKDGQRPCAIGERVPSCDPGMKEDFKKNQCVALKAGETPFTGGLSSLAGYWGATLQAHCKQLLGGIPINGDDKLGVGARCGRDVTAGFACAAARDIAAGHTDTVNSLMETPANVASLADQMNAAANNSPCKELGEKFSKATRYAKATGKVLQIECPAGQFWDPDGYCYSCPKDYTRTLFPVTDTRACTDAVGANMLKFGCGAFQGVAKNFTGPLDCTIEVLEDGSLFDKKLDLKNADQVVCMATGELGYYIVRTGVDIGKAAATGDFSGIITAIGRVKSSVSNATVLKRLEQCRKQK